MRVISCDVAVIGAGTAGLAAERAARKVGADTLIIDDRFAGTTCATVGCMPSKLLIAAGSAAHRVRQASTFGIRVPQPIIDGQAVLERLRGERDAFVSETLKEIAHISPTKRIQGRARFIDRTTLRLDDSCNVLAKAIVIATGARPSVPKMFEVLGELLLTNETIFDLPALPASIAVVGAGPLGLEIAQALARLGVDAEVFERSDHVAGLRDEEVAKELRSILGAEFPIRLGVNLEVAREKDLARVTWSGASAGTRWFDRVLIAAGRPPELFHLNLASTGIPIEKEGMPHVDNATLQCGNAPIFIAGDANGRRPVLHEASAEGVIAGRNAATYPDVRPGKRTTALSIMFTDPPMATIGAPPAETSIVGTGSYAQQGRAKIEARAAGLVRIYADRTAGLISGAVLLGPGMDHMAHLFAWAIERGETATRMLELPFYHPTLEEGLRGPLREIRESIGSPCLPQFDSIGRASNSK